MAHVAVSPCIQSGTKSPVRAFEIDWPKLKTPKIFEG
jgi:hypothetical protein